MKKRVVHYARLLSEQDDISACGLEMYANPTVKKSEVTCKNCERCLRKRAK